MSKSLYCLVELILRKVSQKDNSVRFKYANTTQKLKAPKIHKTSIRFCGIKYLLGSIIAVRRLLTS